MTPEYANQVTAGLLILWFVTVLGMGMVLSLLAVGYVKKGRKTRDRAIEEAENQPAPERILATAFDQPCRWMAIRGNDLAAVHGALKLHNPQPCSWGDGVSRSLQQKLFVSPPIQGWILVVGQGLPDVMEDVDVCYRFILRVGRLLGQVQYFSVNRAVNHHCWVRAEGDRIIRGYAWAGETLWNQGAMTAPEIELGIECLDYGVESSFSLFGSEESYQQNADKLFFLAACWSIDPTSIDETTLPAALGITGELSHTRTF